MNPFGSKPVSPKRGKGKKTTTKVITTRSGASQTIRVPHSPGSPSAKEDEGKVKRPAADKVLPITKEEFYELMLMVKHPIIHDEDRLEKAYRYIDFANSVMEEKTEERLDQEMEEMQEGDDNDNSKTDKDPGHVFFRGNMSTTIMLNGVDQIAEKLNSPTWGKAIWDLYRGTGVGVQDVWAVKKENNRVVSALVKFSSRYQKTAAITIVNDIRADIADSLPSRSRVRVNARDAFPKSQMARVQACYTKGYAMKKAGQIQSYRIYNTGEGEPTFEVRTLVNGKPTWRLASALPTGSPRRDAASQESLSSNDEGDDQRHQDLGEDANLDRSSSL